MPVEILHASVRSTVGCARSTEARLSARRTSRTNTQPLVPVAAEQTRSPDPRWMRSCWRKPSRQRERVIEAEQDAEVARAEFHWAVRRLHLRGASLRELAAALQLSHQRVHQIVEAAGGGRRWRRRERTPPELSCSFCGRTQRKTRKLVAGPGVYICEHCVGLADTVVTSGRPEETALGIIEPVPASDKRRRCSFCGTHRHQTTGLATTVDTPPAASSRPTPPSAGSASRSAGRSTPSN
jgi:hypothetical protein